MSGSMPSVMVKKGVEQSQSPPSACAEDVNHRSAAPETGEMAELVKVSRVAARTVARHMRDR